VIDEALTPDSSRFWSAAHYSPAVRRPLSTNSLFATISSECSGRKPRPALNFLLKVVEATRAKYREAYRILAGRELD